MKSEIFHLRYATSVSARGLGLVSEFHRETNLRQLAILKKMTCFVLSKYYFHLLPSYLRYWIQGEECYLEGGLGTMTVSFFWALLWECFSNIISSFLPRYQRTKYSQFLFSRCVCVCVCVRARASPGSCSLELFFFLPQLCFLCTLWKHSNMGPWPGL